MDYLGRMDMDRSRKLEHLGWRVRVFLDGVEVTGRYREADDTPGHTSIDIECTDHQGHPYVTHLDGVDVIIALRKG